jgi:hypothetical protein
VNNYRFFRKDLLFIPANTEANTEWAIQNFSAWVDWRLAFERSNPVPSNLLTCGDTVTLNKWLSLLRDRNKEAGRPAVSIFQFEPASLWTEMAYEEA